tara:strand:- start:2299 stop:3534 length:1236 start_codon:yes stop_codon:yes gene_type:complete
MKSFLKIDPDSHFSIHNLPYGVFKTTDNQNSRVGIAIGDKVLDLSVIENAGYFDSILSKTVFSCGSLNPFISLGKSVWSQIRLKIQSLLSDDSDLKDNLELINRCLIPMPLAVMCLPCKIGDYTDFYSSKEHATNVGTMFRGKDNALNPNWLHLPVAYHGRSSSIVVGGTQIKRPYGQILDAENKPKFSLSKLMDFELEMGFFIGKENTMGSPIEIENATDSIFGMVIVNDWSARDIQKWEYVPLGPFLGKNFATSISPWVVTMEALEPFKVEGPLQNPQPLNYLKRKEYNSYDIKLEVSLKIDGSNQPKVISRSNHKYLYWDVAQQLVHHSVNGCKMQIGDLLASGTISGPDRTSLGSMLEISWKGTRPIKFENGIQRKFLQDKDSVVMTGYCQGNGYRVGFGEVEGTII